MAATERFHLVTSNRDVIEHRVRHLYANIVWTHKIHEKQADALSKERDHTDHWSMGLTALAGSGIFASGLVDSGLVDQKALSVISLFAAAAAIYFDLKSHLTDYGKTIAEQSVSARTFLALRDETLDLLTALHFDEVDSSEAAEVLATIEAAYAKACQDAPRTTEKAVEQAGRALKGGEETYTEDEIDRLLPEYLRRGK